MSGHRRYRRRRSSESWTSGSSRSTSRSSRRAATTETVGDVHGSTHDRQLKGSSASLPVRRRSPAARHRSWVLLNRTGARRDGFPGDHTTSATSCTSRGEEISVSFELVDPPGTSILTVDWPPPPSMTPKKLKYSGNVIAAHRDVLLLAISSFYNDKYPRDIAVDLFVYQASRDDPCRHRPPSLLLLPSAGRPLIHSHRIMSTQDIGIMSCTSGDVDDDDSPPSFIVAELWITHQGKSNVCVFRRGSSQWECFENLHVHGANGGRDLPWWSADTVVLYGRRYMIWADYYRVMVLMDMYWHSSQSSEKDNQPPPPRLWYMPFPVDIVEDPHDNEFGTRECPKASRCVSVTRYGVMFVSVDTQHWTNFGVGARDKLKWSRRFRITTWWLCEDDWTWRKDLTVHEEEFWDVFDRGDHRFRLPHVQPEFPVVDVENPDVVLFRLEDGYCEPKWMIEVDLRKKVLREATVYSKKSDGLSGDAEAIKYVRVCHYDPILSELPRYMDGGQTCKRRRL